jgi:hypothetical protein
MNKLPSASIMNESAHIIRRCTVDGIQIRRPVIRPNNEDVI